VAITVDSTPVRAVGTSTTTTKPRAERFRPNLSAPQMIAIDLLQPSDSPRLDGEKSEHTQVLAQSEEKLPPIIVHRETMRVIDGMHRLRAAQVRGETLIEGRFFDGSVTEAFILSVEENIAHGLPLSLADRTAAATRILTCHPEWSDRAIASASGLAAKTVSSLRQRTVGSGGNTEARVGRDGRLRPVNSAEGRKLAGEFIARNPEASLRQVAEVVGISPGTVRDVRARLNRGEAPIPSRHRDLVAQDTKPKITAIAPARTKTPCRPAGQHDCGSILDNLRKNPSLRYTDIGRYLLRLLDFHSIPAQRQSQLIDQIPPHCAPMIAEVAQACADAWTAFAKQLEHRHAESAMPASLPIASR
jgi:hypothetical protein